MQGVCFSLHFLVAFISLGCYPLEFISLLGFPDRLFLIIILFFPSFFPWQFSLPLSTFSETEFKGLYLALYLSLGILQPFRWLLLLWLFLTWPLSGPHTFCCWLNIFNISQTSQKDPERTHCLSSQLWFSSFKLFWLKASTQSSSKNPWRF